MNLSKEEYLHLIQQTKQYILQEYAAIENDVDKNKKWVVSDLETYHVFKDYALKNKKPTSQQAPSCAMPHILKKSEETLPKFGYKENFQEHIVNVKPAISTKIEVQNNFSTPKIEPAQPLPYIEEQPNKNSFLQEPLKPASLHDLTDIKKQVQHLFPWTKILGTIPSPDLEVIIVSDHNDKKSAIFLSNLAKAIDIRLKTCRILTSKKFLESNNFQKLKMVIRTDPKIPLKDEIQDVELFDIMKFITNPNDKATLWKVIENGLLS